MDGLRFEPFSSQRFMANVAAVVAAAKTTVLRSRFIVHSSGLVSGNRASDHFFAGSSDGDEWALPCPAMGIDSDSCFFDIVPIGLVSGVSVPRAAESVVEIGGVAGDGMEVSTTGAGAETIAGGCFGALVLVSPHA
jgi:hypothetical protein